MYKAQIEAYTIHLNYFTEKYNIKRINPYYPLFELAQLPPQYYEHIEGLQPASVLCHSKSTSQVNLKQLAKTKGEGNIITKFTILIYQLQLRIRI